MFCYLCASFAKRMRNSPVYIIISDTLSYIIGGGDKNLLINTLHICHTDSVRSLRVFCAPITQFNIYTKWKQKRKKSI